MKMIGVQFLTAIADPESCWFLSPQIVGFFRSEALARPQNIKIKMNNF